MSAATNDVVVLGGGLAGQLCVLALARHAPAASIALVERAPALGGNHTWCCHASDLACADGDAVSLSAWFPALVDRRWPGHRVRFPGFERRLDGEYLCLRSPSLARATLQALANGRDRLLVGNEVEAVAGNVVRLTSGEVLTARLVIDARGGMQGAYARRAGYQKFVGWEIDLEAAWPGDGLPVLMDATVAQADGYRFMYVLPFSPTRLLVEDTCFSRSAELDVEGTRLRLLAYLHEHGRGRFARLREEVGVLPMPWSAPEREATGGLAIGYRGGFFHPATGYSLPRAAIVADRIARVLATTAEGDVAEAVTEAVAELRVSWAANDRFGRLLNRLAFGLVPERRLRDAIFACIYRLPEPVLARFYAGRATRRDRLALLAAPLGLSSLRLIPSDPLPGESP